jgi:hypothetical protein
MKNLRTAGEVVDAIGLDRVCELTESNPKGVWHWTGRTGVFPAYTYVALQKALKKRRCRAPDSLWNMVGIDA